MKQQLLGDFTGLAENYSKYRPAYSETVLSAILSLIDQSEGNCVFADVGAGTGIWTRMIAAAAPAADVFAVEPNLEMRECGARDSIDSKINWMEGSGENIPLLDRSVDCITMASSFHWADFNKAVNEFSRVLKPGGRFVPLWNPRHIEVSPLLVEIEDQLYKLAPNLKRVSSGNSPFTEALTDRLYASGLFEDVLYLEGRHKKRQTPEEYLGVWWSVNDVRAQVGEKIFLTFMDYVKERVKDLTYIETTYLTKAWSARVAE